jgi:hypothetical protein
VAGPEPALTTFMARVAGNRGGRPRSAQETRPARGWAFLAPVKPGRQRVRGPVLVRRGRGGAVGRAVQAGLWIIMLAEYLALSRPIHAAG